MFLSAVQSHRAAAMTGGLVFAAPFHAIIIIFGAPGKKRRGVRVVGSAQDLCGPIYGQRLDAAFNGLERRSRQLR